VDEECKIMKKEALVITQKHVPDSHQG